jgi:hypothetical protein
MTPGALRAALEQALTGGALERLTATRDLRALLYAWEAELARTAVDEGASWEDVGAVLGVSRQAAWTRFRKPGEGTAIREARARIDEARARVSRSPGA